jgi:sugar phosphate isomerase/epimerase
MVLSISTAAFDGYPFATAVEAVAEAGARHIEPAYIQGYTDFDETSFSDANARTLVSAMRACGIEALAISAHVNAGAPDGAEMLARRLRFAAAVGARILITNSAPPEDRAQLRRNIDAALPVCEATGVTIAFENPGHGRSIIGNGAEGVALVEAIGSPFVRLNYDIGNVFTYSRESVRPQDDMPAALPWVAHVHAKDVRATPEGWSFTPIGGGSIDYAAMGRLLAARPEIPVGLELPLRLSRPGRGDPVRRPAPLPLEGIRQAVRDSVAFWQAAVVPG